MNKITGEDVAALLHGIHRHSEREEEIIYYEKDLLPVLKALGLPEPVWKKSMSLEEWKKSQEENLMKGKLVSLSSDKNPYVKYQENGEVKQIPVGSVHTPQWFMENLNRVVEFEKMKLHDREVAILKPT